MNIPVSSLLKIALLFSAALILAGCSRTVGTASGPIFAPSIATTASSPDTPVPGEITQTAIQSTDASQFINAQAFAQLSENEKREAASAQFYALQFGRPGAPRNWSGDKGARGRITVGPFVRVNSRDCREFTHEVIIDQLELSKSGTSCRGTDGTWSVVAS